ncbi:Ni,Fe-hydrogenase III large subunit [Desulfosporosinus acidiphilus SJ4]|uniref:Ni,Fe-hydrogenase III large subunit n=2 Tax=Desulfosporosinus TaxID=79206 RepID=I4D0S4_DESAJ|nr:Ni,Fe-hydrogenase III large subunit [Desulfosporosinus acidiphilus SJ4]
MTMLNLIENLEGEFSLKVFSGQEFSETAFPPRTKSSTNNFRAASEPYEENLKDAGSSNRDDKSAPKPDNTYYLEVPLERIKEICSYIQEIGYPLVLMFANDEQNFQAGYAVNYVFAAREEGMLLVIKTKVDPETMEIPSISNQVHAASGYEREIQDLFGIVPVGHPDGKRLVFHSNWPQGAYPLRKDFAVGQKPAFAQEKIRFQEVEGEGVFEIPVGPVHAGIIEPGHFRFSVAGEPVINLEAQLYFVHKGIEKLAESQSIEKCLYIAERVSGDETFANSLAYCQAIEKIAEMKIPVRAAYTRVLFAELERLTSHLGDLGGICLDTGYGFANFQFQMMRGWAYLIADELCGMRFLRSVNKLGGVRKDFVSGKEAKQIELLLKIRTELEDTVNIIKSNSMFIDRVENTGILETKIAVDLNAVGPGGRASGIRYDVRKAFPYAAYANLEFNVPEHNNGDINCRMNTKIEECFESISLMIQVLEGMPEGKVCEPIAEVKPYRFAFGLTEAPRGENIHWLMTGENNTIYRYKIRTPSFCNWPALCHAVKGNIVPDFPLINKSFNLSYAGNDL